VTRDVKAAGDNSCRRIHRFIIAPPIQYVDSWNVVSGCQQVLVEVIPLIVDGILLQAADWVNSPFDGGGFASPTTSSVVSSYGREELTLTSTCSFMPCVLSAVCYVGKPSTIGQPTRPTQPFISSGLIDE